ncbi:MAG: nitrate ABC transporter ATP-binding protein [Verrucomicrobiales bacterium]|nr:nitrate ABC transporter ATP-binding protein [Verrucomicrobiales bacterium]
MARKRLNRLCVPRKLNRQNETLRIGFVPLVDCAPIAVAAEAGIFARRGLNVQLMREPGWASIRDKVAYGELEAAHAPVGLAFALNWGLGVLRQPCLTGYLLNSNGDAITFSNEFNERGVLDPKTLAKYIQTERRDRPVTFAVPHLFSTHHFLLLHWLRPAGLQSGRDYQVIILPPSLMATCLASGNIDGYCVGEPFNTQAVQEEAGVIVAESAQVAPMHPEKALVVTEAFEEREHDLHMALIEAIAEAAAHCETPEGRDIAADILSHPQFLGLDKDLIRSSLFAGDESEGAVSSERFHVFSHPEVNRPTLDKANWLLAQMRYAGLITDAEVKSGPSINRIFREDLFDQATASQQASDRNISLKLL